MIWPVLVILAAILKIDEKQENLLNICFIIYYKKTQARNASGLGKCNTSRNNNKWVDFETEKSSFLWSRLWGEQELSDKSVEVEVSIRNQIEI